MYSYVNPAVFVIFQTVFNPYRIGDERLCYRGRGSINFVLMHYLHIVGFADFTNDFRTLIFNRRPDIYAFKYFRSNHEFQRVNGRSVRYGNLGIHDEKVQKGCNPFLTGEIKVYVFEEFLVVCDVNPRIFIIFDIPFDYDSRNEVSCVYFYFLST